ncbi:zinc-binding alcohol dehydrogenase family protein [Pectobacterium cacticida]|uniref:Zinc-binding alcohol dehydrogenase family protein n=1 Tax=Pectobacterium cacticida TaxID=69221 RepID=A0ABZ2G5M8_9GAMM|nr:zinc-binding alcohol dehydrogenase family protein [Pectobacterium cacticida]UYX08422.1 zinc-binding alcohol dehydrogenase family protein [Pectobacterium cacticida]
MKTLICREPTCFEYKERPVPTPAENEVLLKVKTIGICGTDIHAWAGKQPFFNYPRVLGHEICGVIVAIGNKVTHFSVGQQAAVIPYLSCNRCSACFDHRPNCCENISVIGVHQDGGMVEYITVPESNVLLAEGITPAAAALIEPFAISAHAIRRAECQPEDNVLVVGGGPIGLGIAAIGIADGVNLVLADTQAERRLHAHQRLSIAVLDPTDPQFERQLRASFQGELPNKVIDATGNEFAMNNSVNLIRHGGHIIFVGLFKGNLSFSDPDFHKKETTMKGSRNATHEDFAKVARLMREGKIDAKMMLSHRFNFSSLAEIYETQIVNNKNLLKAVVEF